MSKLRIQNVENTFFGHALKNENAQTPIIISNYGIFFIVNT